MIKDIKFNGYSAIPSDYECPDGSLAASLNLLCEDSQVKPIFQPKSKLMLCNHGKLLLIHKVQNQNNLIILRDNNLYWMPEPRDGSVVSDSSATFIKQFDTICDIAIIGNTIAVASDSIEYLLWKDGAYMPLGDRPPFLTIQFGCKYVGKLDQSDTLNVPARNVRSQWVPDSTQETANAVLALLLPPIADQITAKGLFYMPFFVRYAFRLYDGSYYWHSAPILMLPSVIIPQILIQDIQIADSRLSVLSKLDIPYFRLMFKIPDLPSLDLWSDIVSSVDVFITPQIYTYDQSASVSAFSDTRSLLLSGYHDYNPNPFDSRGHQYGSSPDRIFSGHYASISDNNFVDHFRSTDSNSSQQAWRLIPNPHFHDQIKSCNGGIFYHIASMPLNSLSVMNDFSPLPLASAKFDDLVTRSTLPDEYQAHHSLSADSIYVYNNRLCLASISVCPPPPFPLASCLQASSPIDPDDAKQVSIEVFSRIGSVKCHSFTMIHPGNFWDISNHFPRYIYYPDSSAYKMNLRYDGQNHFIDLQPHQSLNGAFFYGSLADNATPLDFAPAETDSPLPFVKCPNKIYLSEVNNPFIFPPSYIVSVGDGSVRALASAAKALSQGQFGQFPLYAFTSEGVWALEVSSSGTFSARQPISRDVILENTPPLQAENSVLFPTHRGIMLISGSNTQCISDVINNIESLNLADNLPALDRLLPRLALDNDSSFYINTF